MEKTLQPQILTIVIVAHNHNPTILNPDFLYRNKIVPDDWKKAEDPICTGPLARVIFQNGIAIEAQFDKLLFREADTAAIPEKTPLGQIAVRYVDTLPHVTYGPVGINPHGYVECDSEEQMRLFLTSTLLSDGPWREVGDEPPHAGVRLVYKIGDCRCALSIEEARVRSGEGANEKPALLFKANFHREVTGPSQDQKLDYLRTVIRDWRRDYERFQQIVGENFLKELGPCLQH